MMKKLKVSSLKGAALDWAVAKCEEPSGRDNAERFLRDHQIGFTTKYSETWSQGGPIIEREKMTVEPLFFLEGGWRAFHHNLRYDDAGEYIDGSDNMQDSPTPLIAAMRCYVASKLGDEVEIPEELCPSV